MSIKGSQILRFGFLLAVLFLYSGSVYSQVFNFREKKEKKKKLLQNKQMAMYKKDLYLSLKKTRGIERKYHLGDPISVLLNDGSVIQGELTRLSEDEIYITEGDEKIGKYDLQQMYLGDVEAINRHFTYKGLHWEWSVLALGPIFDDWVFRRVRPGQDPTTFVQIGVVEAITLLTSNRKKFFNKMEIAEGERELRVLRY